MKLKHLLLIPLLCLALISKAQLTADFPDSNYHWNEKHYTKDCETCVSQYVEGTMFDSTNHIINGLSYRSIYFKGSAYGIIYDPIRIINSTSFTALTGYIRNDKLNKKVYFRNQISDTTSDQLLYDFNLKLGDLYPSTKQHNTSDSTYVFKIDTLIDPYGITRTVTYVGDSNKLLGLQEGVGVIIEGIGTLSGLLSNSIFRRIWIGASNDLECFSYDTLNYGISDFLTYPFYFSSTNVCKEHQYLFVSVDSNKKLTVNITPNPVTSTFTINIPDEEATFSILNTLGQVQKMAIIREGTIWKLDASLLENGIYFINILTDKNHYSSRFIKAN
jgi:hypothetical protein